jgi:hypothetical protein
MKPHFTGLMTSGVGQMTRCGGGLQTLNSALSGSGLLLCKTRIGSYFQLLARSPG